MEIDQNLQIHLVSCLSRRLLYLRRDAFLTYYLLKVYFSLKIILKDTEPSLIGVKKALKCSYLTVKSDPEPD
jgi:hypothetical protein